MKIGIHYLFGLKEADADWIHMIDRFSDVGFDCIELPPDPFIGPGIEKFREVNAYAKECGVEIVFSTGFDEAYDIAGNKKQCQQGIDHLKKIIDLMIREDIRLLGGTCYTKWPNLRKVPLTKTEKNEILERTAEIFGKTVSGIEDTGITIAIEPLNRFEGFLINTAEEGVKFCELTKNPNVGVMLDGFHMSMEEDSLYEAVLKCGKRLKHVHLAENNRKLPGMGEFPWDKYFEALSRIGYKGRLDIESFMIPGGGIAADVALWRDMGCSEQCIEQNKLLERSLEFIRAKCTAYGIN